VASFTQLSSGNWRVQVRRKNRYVSETFRRRKDGEDLGARYGAQHRPQWITKTEGCCAGSNFGDIVDLHVEDTLAAIRDLLTSTLDAAGPEDTVILSFVGHGTHDHRLVTHDTQFSDLAATTLPMDELARRFKVSRAKAVICFLDCCFSGGAPARVLEGSPIPRDAGSAFVEITGNGRVLFAACGVTEEALEDPISQQGLFTQAIIALLQEGDIANSVVKLVHDTTVRVRADAARFGYVQTPVMFGHVEGEIAVPVLRPGTEYNALFPDASSVQVGILLKK
jgi:helicase